MGGSGMWIQLWPMAENVHDLAEFTPGVKENTAKSRNKGYALSPRTGIRASLPSYRIRLPHRSSCQRSTEHSGKWQVCLLRNCYTNPFPQTCLHYDKTGIGKP